MATDPRIDDIEEFLLKKLPEEDKIINKGMLLIPIALMQISERNKTLGISKARVIGKEIYNIVGNDIGRLEDYLEKSSLGNLKIHAISNEEALVFNDETNPFVAGVLSGYFTNYFSKPVGFQVEGAGKIKISPESGFVLGKTEVSQKNFYSMFFRSLEENYTSGKFIKEKIFAIQMEPFLKYERNAIAKLMRNLGANIPSKNLDGAEKYLRYMGFATKFRFSKSKVIALLKPSTSIGAANEAYIVQNFLLGALKKIYKSGFQSSVKVKKVKDGVLIKLEFEKKKLFGVFG